MKRFFILLLTLSHFSICNAKLYDSFTFFNELELLEVRFDELYEMVDYFVLVEARQTFSGKPKPLFFAENAQRFKKYQDKIIHVVVDSFPFKENKEDTSCLRQEEFQRNAILLGLTQCEETDIILISDVDEIPNKGALAKVKRHFKDLFPSADFQQSICEMQMRYFLFFLNWENPMGWNGVVKAALYSTVRKISPHALRLMSRPEWIKVEDGGWHFSTMGGEKRLIEKYKSGGTGHTISDDYFNDFDFEKFITETARVNGLETVFLDRTFPKYILDHKSYFSSLGWLKNRANYSSTQLGISSTTP